MWDKLISFINAVIIHGLLVALVFLNMEWFFKPHLISSPSPEKMMRAVAMNESQVLAAIKKIKSNPADQNKSLLAHEQQLEKKKRQVKQTVLKEQQRLNKLRQQQEKQQQQLEKLKQRRWAKASELEELKHQRAEQKRLEREAQEKKRIAEAQRRIAQEAAEREKRQQEEAQRQADQAKREAERQARLAAEEAQRQAAAEQAKQEAERQARETREAEEKRRKAQEKAATARQTDDHERIKQVIELIQEKIKNQWMKPRGVPDNLACIIYIRLKLGGKVGSARVTESSGNIAFDYSAEVAVRRASPLPIPVDLFDKFVEFQLRFRP